MEKNFDALKQIDLTDDDLFIFQDSETGFKQKITVTQLIKELALPTGIGPLHLAVDVGAADSYFDLLADSRTLLAAQAGMLNEGVDIGSPYGCYLQITGADYKDTVARIAPQHVGEFAISCEPVLSLVDNGVDKITFTLGRSLPFPSNPTLLTFNLVGGMDDTHAAAIGASTVYTAMTIEDVDGKVFSLPITIDGTDYGPDDGLFIEFAVLELFAPLSVLYGIAAPQVLHVTAMP